MLVAINDSETLSKIWGNSDKPFFISEDKKLSLVKLIRLKFPD